MLDMQKMHAKVMLVSYSFKIFYCNTTYERE